MKRIIKCFALFTIGGMLYVAIEIFARGYSHFSMFLLGGLCFLLIGFINERGPALSITTQMLIGCAIITALEFLSGCILNLWLGWGVWDYSADPYNLLGQICAKNCFYWFWLSAVAIVVDDTIRCVFFSETPPEYFL